ncbi:MAG: hypothetical protein ACR2Q3_03455 [Woeseiaceae bacterium]
MRAQITHRTLLAMVALLICGAMAFAQERKSAAERINGVWRMDPRTLRSPALTSYQEDGTVTFTQLEDGRFSAIARITTRLVSETEETFTMPGCEGETECTIDSASEGIASVFGNSMYVDWIDDGWIDDFFKISGNEMDGDDGNGPIHLVKQE